MGSLKIFLLAMMIAVSSAAVSANASTLYCNVGVYTVKDVLDEKGAMTPVNTKTIELPLAADGSGEQEFQINGETVSVTASKYEYADLYRLSVVLMTPISYRAKLTRLVAIADDLIVNDGPTKQNGWDLKPSATAVRYAFVNRVSGTLGLSTKMINALKAAGEWGKGAFTENQIDVSAAYPYVDFIKDQVAQKKMSETDVVGIATMFSCTIDK